jgi:DNA-binding transcriptional MerR regulator
MGHNQSIRRITHSSGAQTSEIPDKLYFRIGEVARLCKVPAYVLRFWESEFPQLKPNKGGTGQRLYRRRDVEMAMRVKTLLKDEGYTIPGARAVLKSEFRQKEPQLSLLGEAVPKSEAKQLRALRRELEAIAAMLSQPIARIAGAPKSSKKLLQQAVNGDRPSAPIHAARRSSSRTQPGTDAATPEPSSRTPSDDFLFNNPAAGPNSDGDGN